MTETINAKMSIVYEFDDDTASNELGNSDVEDFNDTIAGNVIVSRRKPLKKRSPVWKYFNEIEDGGYRYAVCKLCVDK